MPKINLQPHDDPAQVLRHIIQEVTWQPVLDGKADMVYRTETRIPMPVQLEQLEAEQASLTMRAVFTELYDRLETMAMEMKLDKPLAISNNWKSAVDKMVDLYLDCLTNPAYSAFVNKSYPPSAEGFGKNIIQLYAGGAIAKVGGEPGYTLHFAGWANTGIQAYDNVLKYSVGINLRTVY